MLRSTGHENTQIPLSVFDAPKIWSPVGVILLLIPLRQRHTHRAAAEASCVLVHERAVSQLYKPAPAPATGSELDLLSSPIPSSPFPRLAHMSAKDDIKSGKSEFVGTEEVEHLEKKPSSSFNDTKDDGYLLSADVRPSAERALVRKLDMRLLPTIILIFIMNYIDVSLFPHVFRRRIVPM